MARSRNRTRGAFTLIELMVVIAIIALLIAILLPSLQSARQHAKAVTCATNLHHVGLAMANYLYTSRGTYPSSYLYPDDEEGNWSFAQQETKPFGYMHWSYFLFEGGQVNDKAFQCPIYENGGAPRTNPGMNPSDWEGGQVDQNGQSTVNQLTDKQAARMAYTANAAIIPRNKFTSALSGGPRVNTFVREQNIKHPGATIMVTEFLNNWKALGVQQGAAVESKSHRPINPFYHVGSGFNEYQTPPQAPGFIYGTPSDTETYGLLPLSEVRDRSNILDYTSGVAQINAIGRHHPNSNTVYAKKYGGVSNFLYADTHVESMTALDSVVKRQWGDRYNSVTGENQILNMSRVNANNNP
jgi:prepilin-type N-terminal cleavage/methylation domain-containing protein/prepilin-type processing-associated H-X9-DG protein